MEQFVHEASCLITVSYKMLGMQEVTISYIEYELVDDYPK